MENGAFLRGEKLWLWGREVTFLRYQSLEYPGTGPGIAEAVVQRAGEIGTRNVPVWILARDQAESFSRASAIPEQLEGCWDWD
jgi:hypothetical protein